MYAQSEGEQCERFIRIHGGNIMGNMAISATPLTDVANRSERMLNDVRMIVREDKEDAYIKKGPLNDVVEKSDRIIAKQQQDTKANAGAILDMKV